jgi:transposase
MRLLVRIDPDHYAARHQSPPPCRSRQQEQPRRARLNPDRQQVARLFKATLGCTKDLGQRLLDWEDLSMPERRRKFSAQYKAEAVQMVIETGKPIADVARDLGVNDGTLGNWVKAWRDGNPEPEPDLSPVERARVREMEDEIRRLRMENEPLKMPLPSSPGRRNS